MTDEITMDNEQILFDLIRKNRWDELKDMINNSDMNLDLNIRDKQNNYLIIYAILFNRPDIVKLLIEHGARIDVTDTEERSLLYLAIKYNYQEILDILLKTNEDNIGVQIFDIRDKSNYVPLHYGIIYNNITAIKKMLDRGANPNTYENRGYNSLHLSIFYRSYEMCKLILDYNIDINSRCNSGETALHIACNLELFDIIELLLKRGINVNSQDYDHEFSALHYAISSNNKHIVKLLLAYDVDVNLQDIAGNTPMHYAVIERNLECLTLLVNKFHDDLRKNNRNNRIKNYSSYKVNFNLWNFDGNIPLHLALSASDISNIDEYINLMLEQSNINIQNNIGDTCLLLLCEHKLWHNYVDILKEKKLDIFVMNKYSMRPIDYIMKTELDLFMNMVADSYLHRLRSRDELWENEWENMCKKELFIDDLDEKQLNYLKKDVKFNDNNINKKTDICHSIIKKRLLDMYNTKDGTKYCSKSFPSKHGAMCINVSEGQNLSICTFTGTTLDILIGLVYLLKKFPNACSTFSRNFAENKELCKFYKSIGVIMNTHCEFLNFEIVWVYHKLYLMDDFVDNFKKCNSSNNIRFIIIPIGIELREGSHANYLIYDKNNKEVERFEPHGSSAPTGFNYNASLLDNILEMRFKEIDNEIRYIRPKNYLPKIGFQLMDISERKNKKIGDPGGFCALWAVWWVDMRLTYPDFSREQLVTQMISAIKSKNISFKNLIRNYAKNIIDIRDMILDKAGIDINDWLNDQFTNSQIDIISRELVREIDKVKL